MHGQQTMKFLNGNAVAQKIMAERKVTEIDPKLDQAYKELVALKAQAQAK